MKKSVASLQGGPPLDELGAPLSCAEGRRDEVPRGKKDW
jgi:hypothetical protein